MKRRDFFGAIAAAIAAPKLLPAGEVLAPAVGPMVETTQFIASGHYFHPIEITRFDDAEQQWLMRFRQ